MGRPSALVRGILILALGFTTRVNAQCSRSIEAHDGDTCASLAALTGITVAQFLKSNPSVTSCSALTPGKNYCVDGTAPAVPSSSTGAVPTSSPLQVSTDGTCGPGVTCKGSRFGSCCSAHGFCGSTADYCGDGCQASLGTCGSDPGQPSNTITSPPAGTPTSTVTVTSTAIVTITRASIVLQTSTVLVTSAVLSTSTRTALATATVTATVTSTAVATTTATATARATATATVLQTSIVTLTSIVFSTSTQFQTAITTSTAVATRTAVTTVTSTNRVTATSVVIETLTTIKTVSVTSVNTIGCGGGGGLITTIWQTSGRPTPTIIITTRIPGGPSQPRPTPYLPGSSRNCRSYDLIQQGDTCRQIANRNSVSLLDFYKLNPSVSAKKDPSLLGGLLCTPDLLELLLSGLCQIDCDDLWPGYWVCVEES